MNLAQILKGRMPEGCWVALAAVVAPVIGVT